MFLKAQINMLKEWRRVHKNLVYLSCHIKMIGPKLALHWPMQDIGGECHWHNLFEILKYSHNFGIGRGDPRSLTQLLKSCYNTR